MLGSDGVLVQVRQDRSQHKSAALESGHEPELSLDRALRGTEIIFAMYESCRRRARVDLPLQIPDNPFIAMLEAGDFGKV